MAKTENASASDGAEVTVIRADLRTIQIVCAEPVGDEGALCGRTVDVVGYDAAPQRPAAVVALMGTLDVSEKEARSLVADRNPDALRTQEENARALAEQIVSKSVPDRDASTYVCP